MGNRVRGEVVLDRSEVEALRSEVERLTRIISEIRRHALTWALQAPEHGDRALEILRLVNDGTTGPTIGEGKR